MLCDWDLSKFKEELGLLANPTQPDRTVSRQGLLLRTGKKTISTSNLQGTWQFKSALILLFPWKDYELADDVESFIHVINYLVLKYHPTSLNGELLESHVNNFFAFHCVQNAVHFGGDLKWQLLQRTDKAPYMAAGPVGRDAVQELIDSLAALCHNHYQMKRPWVEAEVSSLKTPHPSPLMRLQVQAEQPESDDSKSPPVEPSEFDNHVFEYDVSADDTSNVLEPAASGATLKNSPPVETSSQTPSAFGSPSLRLAGITSSAGHSTGPPAPETTLQDHRGLRRTLIDALKNAKWHKADKASDQFAGFQVSGSGRDSKWPLTFRSDFSTSEQFALADSGRPSVAKRNIPQRKVAKRRKKVAKSRDVSDSESDDGGDDYESEDEDRESED